MIYNELANQLKETYDKKVLSLDDYGANLSILHPVSSVAVAEDGFIYYVQDQKKEWAVSQVGSIDEEDRVQFAIDKIKNLVEQHYQGN